MQRRAIFTVGAAALSGAALRPLAASTETRSEWADVGFVSVKDPRFGARGDFHSDDTAAIQAAVDYCFGSRSSPHGTAQVNSNQILLFPPGNYRISAPIHFEKLHGGRVLGSGRFVTKVTNNKGGSVFVANGCGYSHFEGLYLHSEGRTAAVFNLDWDGTAGGAALQSNAFIDVLFDGGSFGIEIGTDGHMGSENIFVNCYWIYSAVAGLKTSNFNALQNTVIGGNMQSCNIGIWIERGSVCVIEGVGFQQSRDWDVRVDNSANDTINIIGCRTESSNFVQLRNSVHACIVGCTQTEAGQPGIFLQPNDSPVTVERSVSLKGQVQLSSAPRLTVRGCSFGRKDWLQYGDIRPGHAVELEDVQYGGTPNSSAAGSASKIARQRITSDGIHEYVTALVTK